jgi:hypothetical protein
MSAVREIRQTYYGPLPVVQIARSAVRHTAYDCEYVEIDGVLCYLHECPAGEGTLASESCCGTDYGSNVIHAPRRPPASLVGIAAPLRGFPVRESFSAPVYMVEIV